MPAANPQVHAQVARAVLTGALVRPAVCEQCGKPPNGKGKIHAHHPDYDKPLEVEWLCPKCHRSRPTGPNIRGPGFVIVRIPDDLRDRIDAVRPATVSREAWVRLACELLVAQDQEALAIEAKEKKAI